MHLPNIPKYPNYVRLGLKDKPIIDGLAKDRFIGDITFSNLYNWRANGIFTQLSQINKNCIISSCDLSLKARQLFVLGQNDITKTMDTLLNDVSSVLIPETTYKNNQSQLVKVFDIIEDDANAEYVVKISDLLKLRGEKYRVIRSDLHKFTNRFSPDVLIKLSRIGRGKKLLYNEVNGLFKKWDSYKAIDGSIVNYEKESLARLLLHSQIFNLYIVKAYHKDNLIGFGTIELFPEHKMGLIGFLKVLPDYNGLSSTIIYRIASELSKLGFEYINYEQDLGYINLRKFKLKFNPAYFVKKYIVRRKYL